MQYLTSFNNSSIFVDYNTVCKQETSKVYDVKNNNWDFGSILDSAVRGA